MAKGEDAVQRKKSKAIRKRLRSRGGLSDGVASSLAAAKRRRKAGKRRVCEGMCYSLPTPEDPFNDRHDTVARRSKTSKSKSSWKADDDAERLLRVPADGDVPPSLRGINLEAFRFLFTCLNTMVDAQEELGFLDLRGEVGNIWSHGLFYGAQDGKDVLDTSGRCARRSQIAWIHAVAADLFASQVVRGDLPSFPFLLYLVPSEERARQVRTMCKPLKPYGIRSVCIHDSTSIEHQTAGLLMMDPVIVVSTPERLLELIENDAFYAFNVSFLVIDELPDPEDRKAVDQLRSITEAVDDDAIKVVFTDSSEKNVTLAKSFLSENHVNLCMIPHDCN